MSSSWFSKEKGRIKHNTYLPAPDNDTSVFRCTEMIAQSVQALLAKHRVTEHGAALVTARTVRDAKLDVLASEPPYRHANIRGWPETIDPEEQKAQRKKLAISIAESAWHMPWPAM